MVKPYVRTLTGANESSTYVGVALTSKIALPKDFLIQRVIIDVRGDIDLATSVLVEDAGMAAIEEIRFDVTEAGTGGGNNSYVSISGIDLFFINFIDNQETPEEVVPSADGTDSPVSFQLVIDFRLEKKNPDDWSVAVPAYDKSSVTLVIKWRAIATGYGTNATNVSWLATVTLIEGIPETQEEFDAFKENPKLTLTATEKTLENSTGSENRNQDVSVGSLLRRLFIFSKTNAGLRSDIQIDWWTFSTVRDGEYYEEAQHEALQMQDKIDYQIKNYDGDRTITGLVILDWARGAVDEFDNVFGLNLVGLKSGDFKMKVSKLVAQPKLRYIQENVEAA